MGLMREHGTWIAIVLLIACGDDGPASDPGTTTGAGSSSGAVLPTTTASDDTSTSSTTSDTGAGSDTELPPFPECGNGEIEGDEECDDTNDDPDDGCDNDCNRSGIVEWTVTWNGAGDPDDVARGVAVAPDGDVWVVGSVSMGRDSFVELRRFDPGGALEGTLVLMSGGDHRGVDLALSDGVLYVAGTSREPVDEGWVVAVDISGTEQWRYTRASTAELEAIEVSAVALGPAGVWVCGQDQRVGKSDDRDAWLVRLDDGGAPLWERSFPGDPDEDAFALAVAVTPEGASLVGGSETRGDQGTDAWLRRYDTDGDEQWTVQEAGSLPFTDERVRGVVINDDGHAIVTGRAENSDGDVVWTAAYDPAGEQLWERTWSGPGELTNGARGVALTAEGDPVIVGSVGIPGEGTDIFVRRYTADGNFELWTSYFSGDAMFTDEGRRTAVALDGSIYAVGETSAPGQGTDGWLRKISGVVPR